MESSTRRWDPDTAPVAATSSRTASKTRSGAALARSRFRHNVSTVGWNAPSVKASPAAAFHATSVRSRAHAARSDRPSNACNNSTDATTSPGTDGRPRPDSNRSSNIASGNNRPRCCANNACTEPSASRCPTHRRRVQQLPIRHRRALHTHIVPHRDHDREHPDPNCSAVS